MGNALVARDVDFRFDPRCAFYSKVIHGLAKRGADPPAGPQTSRRIPSCAEMSSTVARTDRRMPCGRPRSEARGSLGDEKDFVRVRVAHFGAGREAAHVYIALVGCV